MGKQSRRLRLQTGNQKYLKNMSLKKILSLRMWNRFARTQRNIQKLLIQQADRLRLCLLTIDMMFVIRENEKLAIASIVPAIRPMVGQLHDFAFLYLDLPEVGIAAGFYKLLLAYDTAEKYLPHGILVNENDEFIRSVNYYPIDIFASIVGTKTIPQKRLTVFETFNFTHDIYVIGGTHANGQAFVLTF
jgi:hypothetical protein